MAKINDLVSKWREIGPIAWAEGPYGWINDDRQPVTLEPWQRAALAAWWEYREILTILAISNIKKTGKTFANAILTGWRWLALPGEHFCAANDLDQSAGRQFSAIADMVRRNPFLRDNVTSRKEQLIFTPTGSTLTALAVDAAGNAGANHLTVSHTEAWGIVYEAGVRAFEELVPPPGKRWGLPALRICDSYAGFEGESNTWHTLVDRGLKGKRVSQDWPIYLNGGLLLFHIEGEEAQARCYRGTPEEAAIYYADQRSSLRPGTYQRYHENQRSSGSEAFIKLDDWDNCTDPEHRPILPQPYLELFVGVDASIKHDSAAVLAITYDREESRAVLARHRIWQPTALDPLDIDATLGAFLRELHRGYRLRGVLYDPYQMHDLSTRLRQEGLPMQEYPQSVSNLTTMGQNLYELIKAKNLLIYPDTQLRSQAAHAVALQTSRGWRIAKEKSSLKIDGIVALAMACIGAIEFQGHCQWLIR